MHSLEQMRADVEDRERRLRELRLQLDRDGRGSQLQRQRSAKDIQQVHDEGSRYLNTRAVPFCLKIKSRFISRKYSIFDFSICFVSCFH